MKVYYTAATSEFAKHKDYYLKTRESIISHNGKLTNDWIPDYIKKVESGESISDSSEFYQEVMDSIEVADVTIFDATVSSMSIGHQLTYSLHRQKPTLLMLHKDGRKANNLFIAGSNSPDLQMVEYSNIDELEEMVSKFLQDNAGAKEYRLNLALDKKQNDYLAWAAYTYNRTKTDVAKSAIDREMNGDSRYSELRKSQV